MRTLWTRDYMTGETICAICGAPKNDRLSCCKCAPFIQFEKFVTRYFGKDFYLTDYGNRNVAHEFYDDYNHSDCQNLTQYILKTTSETF